MKEVLSPVIIINRKKPPLYFDPIISDHDPINQMIHNIIKDLKRQKPQNQRSQPKHILLRELNFHLYDPVVDADTSTYLPYRLRKVIQN